MHFILISKMQKKVKKVKNPNQVNLMKTIKKFLQKIFKKKKNIRLNQFILNLNNKSLIKKFHHVQLDSQSPV